MKKIFIYGLGLSITVGVASPIVYFAMTSKKNKSILFQGRRTIVTYDTESSYTGNKQRIWDMSVQALNTSSRSEFDLQTTNLFRQRVTQSSKVIYEPNGNPKEVSSKKEEFKFDAINEVIVDEKSFYNANNLIKYLKNHQTDKFIFKIKPGTKYINYKGEKTKYEFKAIDFFYGMMRGIYTSKESLEKGTINGIKTLKPVSKEYLEKLKKHSDFYNKDGKINKGYNNLNLYLYNLYGVDLPSTISLNTGKNYDSDKFVLKFKSSQSDAIIYNFMANNNLITPSPSQKLNDLNEDGKYYTEDFSINGNGKPGKFLKICEFGQLKSQEKKVDLSEQLKVARYYLTSYNTKPNTEGVVIQKNIYSFDKKYNDSKNNLEKIQTLIVDNAIDKDVFAQLRQKSFLTNNSESLLYSKVLEKPSLIQKIKQKGLVSFKAYSKGAMLNQGFWNPWFFIATSETDNQLNENTTKLLFGVEKAKVKTEPKAFSEYFLGRGRQFRTLVNSSINLYSVSRQWRPSASKVKSAKNFTDGQVIIPGTTLADDYSNNLRTAIEHGILLDKDQMEFYSKNKDKPILELLKPNQDKYNSLVKEWNKFLTNARKELNLSSSAKFIFPLYDFRYKGDNKEWTKEKLNAYKKVVEELNSITKKLGLEFKVFNSSGTKEKNMINKRKTAPFLYIGAGPDYVSIMSVIQQLISASYGPFVGVPLIKEALSNDNNEIKTYDPNQQNSYDLNSEISIKDFIRYLKQDQKSYQHILDPKILNKITLTDWHNFITNANSSIAKDILTAMKEFDNAFQKFAFKVAGNIKDIRRYTRLFTDLSIFYKLSFGYDSYASLGPKPDSVLSVSNSYTAPWLHLAQSPSIGTNPINYLDTIVELK